MRMEYCARKTDGRRRFYRDKFIDRESDREIPILYFIGFSKFNGVCFGVVFSTPVVIYYKDMLLSIFSQKDV